MKGKPLYETLQTDKTDEENLIKFMSGNENSGRKPSGIEKETFKLTVTVEQGKIITAMAIRQEWSKAKAARKIFEMGLEALDKKR